MPASPTSNPLLRILNMTKKAELANLTPAHTARIRGQIAAGVGHYLKMADEVMHGTRNWTPTQARVFSPSSTRSCPTSPPASSSTSTPPTTCANSPATNSNASHAARTPSPSSTAAMIINHEKQRLSSNLTLNQFAQAMRQLDLSAVAPENRSKAIQDHLAHIMIHSIHDRTQAAELVAARLLHLKTRR
jgi:hypothetical protein